LPAIVIMGAIIVTYGLAGLFGIAVAAPFVSGSRRHGDDFAAAGTAHRSHSARATRRKHRTRLGIAAFFCLAHPFLMSSPGSTGRSSNPGLACKSAPPCPGCPDQVRAARESETAQNVSPAFRREA
jgi:hypothetical protein